jgi:hypothetical protein
MRGHYGNQTLVGAVPTLADVRHAMTKVLSDQRYMIVVLGNPIPSDPYPLRFGASSSDLAFLKRIVDQTPANYFVGTDLIWDLTTNRPIYMRCSETAAAPCPPAMSGWQAASQDTHRGNYGTNLGAEASEKTPWWKIWAVGLFGIGVFAVGGLADAAGSAAKARWARQEDRSWSKWLKTSPEDRRKWPEERAAWNAWEFEAQRIDDVAAKTAAKKRPKT